MPLFMHFLILCRQVTNALKYSLRTALFDQVALILYYAYLRTLISFSPAHILPKN
ncbi:hypothetical protein Zymop_2039 (plasmid) [Zymomonas mobilis subsp. pomaceae ATCC 29192]|uniref:Uncharacterized protein n=1 Tax=Zymomonas mobilis subsp. pomaceae (strain ATCC 29192 / DSM 22645 / JCM 10191 / CCUG 17912 / NBRC 13757 / NCIMB 11200 / NRRL B-4491 / Barker I) TaxID=579138 RepID=F8EWI0_ZYMMT|nr:hypothetical protein Zymop_2039 [Zymomonas mobilis subsp. pomaceae ATCC 29192]